MQKLSESEYQPDGGPTKDTPYLAIRGELWGLYCEYLWENWPPYNGTGLFGVTGSKWVYEYKLMYS